MKDPMDLVNAWKMTRAVTVRFEGEVADFLRSTANNNGVSVKDLAHSMIQNARTAERGVFELKRPVRAYTFAVLLSHGQWIASEPINSRSEEEARRLIEKAFEKSVISGILLMHEGEVEDG